MQHLLSAITLAKDYGGPPIDLTDFSDLTNWTRSIVTTISQASNSFKVRMPSGQGVTNRPFIKSPLFSPKISSPVYGSRFRITFDLTMTLISGGPTNNFRIHISLRNSATSTVRIGYDVTVPASTNPSGVYSVDVSTINSGMEFDSVLIEILRFGSTGTNAVVDFDFSNIEIISIDNDDNGLFNTGDRVICYWDDVTDAIVVKREDNPGATITTITKGPNLGSLEDNQFTNWHFVPAIPGARVNTAIKVSNYAFCEGNTKNEFVSTTSNPIFPYFERSLIENSPYCVLNPDPDDPPIVCDIHFEGDPVILAFPPDQYSNAGSFQVTAVSSHADISFPIKYSLDAPSYTGNLKSYQQGIGNNTSGIFSGKKRGTYAVYAYDQYNCVAVIQVKLLIDPTSYGPLYRQEYKDIQNLVLSRMDINQSQYAGAINEVYSDGSSPVILNKTSGDINNKFDVLRGTNAEISLIAEKDLQFIGLFSQNDRKFLSVYERPVGNEIWRGFVTPSIYSEPYKSVPYPVKITSVDGLETLSNEEFLNDGGSTITGRLKLISIILICLNKLGLNIGVRSSVNKFAATFSTAFNSDDPLEQTYLDVACFYDEDGTPEKCDTVLEAVLKPFGAEIIQANGWWNIVEVDGKTQSYRYRNFDVNGNYVGDGTYNPIIEVVSPNTVAGILLSDQSTRLDILPAYGKITIEHTLIKKISLLSRTLDIGWQISLANSTAALTTFFDEGLTDSKEIINGSIVSVKKNNKYKGLRINRIDDVFGQFVTLSSDSFSFTTQNDALKISFSYQHLLSQDYEDITSDDTIVSAKVAEPKWVKLKWTLVLVVGATTFKYGERVGWNTLTNPTYYKNDILVDNFERKFNSFDRVIDLPSFTAPQVVSLRLLFQFEGGYSTDFVDVNSLAAIISMTLPLGYKVRGLISGELKYFILRLATSGDGSEMAYIADHPDDKTIPEVDYVGVRVVPDDYLDPNNAVIWAEDLNEGLIIPVESIDIKEVVVTLLPNKKDAIESETISLVINPDYKENTTVELIAGDHPASIIQKEIYTNWFSDINGLPTYGWSRSDFSENTSVQQILMKSLVNQYSKPSFKLSGSFVNLSEWGFLNVIKSTTLPTNISLVDPDFDDTFQWTNLGLGNEWIFPGGPFKPKVDFVIESTDSKYYIPTTETVIPAGIRVRIDLSFSRLNSDAANPKTDRFMIGLFRAGVLVQSVLAVDLISYNSSFVKTIRFNTIADADNIGFFIDNISGPGTASYEMVYFRVAGLSVVRYYGINSLSQNDRQNDRQAELYQLIPAVISNDPDIDDTGGGETDPGNGGPGSGGGSFNGAYSSGYASGFDTVLN